jgi:Tetratricopeptide repeat
MARAMHPTVAYVQCVSRGLTGALAMNNTGFRSWIREIGTLRASVLFVALTGKVFSYILNPPSFISRRPLILPFPFLVLFDFLSAVVTGFIAVECIRIGFPSTSPWTLKKHFAVAGIVIGLFVASKICVISQTSNQYYSYGWALAEKGNYREAMLSLDIAIKYYPRHIKPYLERAYVHRRLGDFAAALNDCDKATDLAPKNADTYACRGYAYYGLCDRDRAVNEWRKAISLDANLSGRLDKWMKAVNDPLYRC